PSAEFRSFAQGLIDLGVDIVHGHSGHIFQGIEVYNNRLIIYNSGDFLDDYAIDNVLRNDQSFLYLVTLDKNNIKELQLIPVVIKNMQVNKASAAQRQAILEKMQRLSAELGTHIPSNGIYQFAE